MRFFKNGQYGSVVMELTEGTQKEEISYKELIAGDSDASAEKHVPVAVKAGKELTVEIGSEPHPMVPEHYITWVAVETDKGGYWKNLSPLDAPKAKFELRADEKVKTVYIYCNIHGLWKSEL